MITILWFIGYLLIGLIAIFATVFAHLVKAECNGYCALEWWNRNYDLKQPLKTDNDIIQFLIGMCMWPMRLYGFISYIPELYQSYDIRVN